jgi:hypothetical protein
VCRTMTYVLIWLVRAERRRIDMKYALEIYKNGTRRRIGGVNICICMLARCWHSSSTSNEVPMVLVSRSPKEHELTLPLGKRSNSNSAEYRATTPSTTSSNNLLKNLPVLQKSGRECCIRRYQTFCHHGYMYIIKDSYTNGRKSRFAMDFNDRPTHNKLIKAVFALSGTC